MLEKKEQQVSSDVHIPGSFRTSKLTSSPVGQTMLDAILGKFMSIGGSKNNITLDLGVNDLGNDILVCESDNKTIFG
jgi:hypothetical protein